MSDKATNSLTGVWDGTFFRLHEFADGRTIDTYRLSLNMDCYRLFSRLFNGLDNRLIRIDVTDLASRESLSPPVVHTHVVAGGG